MHSIDSLGGLEGGTKLAAGSFDFVDSRVRHPNHRIQPPPDDPDRSGGSPLAICFSIPLLPFSHSGSQNRKSANRTNKGSCFQKKSNVSLAIHLLEAS
mmetsp:Transcript_5661/g.11241  ORF Transcript_5661/g.11241 Transcript_5661/m.11241 type:complete len:98 (-) Transcript_5661:456-749(-)